MSTHHAPEPLPSSHAASQEAPQEAPRDFSRVPAAPRSDDRALLDALAADLEAARYVHDGVLELLGPVAMAALDRDQPVQPRRAVARVEATRPLDALSTLVRAFLLGGSVSRERWEAALPTLGLGGASELGLVEADPERPELLRAAIDLRPYASDSHADLWVASDVGSHHRPGVLRHDHVLGIGAASLTLAAATIRRPAATALDLGVGCGIQTFYLLAHCDHVTATDLSARALGFTRFNLALNAAALGLDPQDLEARVSLRQGSLLEPVEGERFELIVSNPPFVITPRRLGESSEERFTYRDGGLPGDQLVAQLWSGLAQVLEPGGTAQMLANWEIPRALVPDDARFSDPVTGTQVPGWAGRPAHWTPPELECWVIQRDVEDPGGYAETWLRDASEVRSPEAAELRYEEYLDDFEARGVGAIGLGLVWLRRRAEGAGSGMIAGSGRIAAEGIGRRFESIQHQVESPLGPTLGQAVWQADAVAAVDVALVHAEAAKDVTVETHSRPGDEHPQAILLRQGSGLRRTRLLPTALAGLVSACDGELPLGSLSRAVVSVLEATEAQNHPSAEELLEQAKELLVDGFLRFPSHSE